MVLATLLLLCPILQADDAAKVAAAANANVERQTLSVTASHDISKDATAVPALPSAPQPKVKPEVEPVALRSAAQPFEPVRSVRRRPGETPRQRKVWYGLMAAGHAGAAFDAWSTRRAISGGYGQESNPFLKPFASSNAIYAATQVSPAFMDYLGKRMMVSQNPWIRKLWWVPQVAGTSMSFVAGAHNVGVVH